MKTGIILTKPLGKWEEARSQLAEEFRKKVAHSIQGGPGGRRTTTLAMKEAQEVQIKMTSQK